MHFNKCQRTNLAWNCSSFTASLLLASLCHIITVFILFASLIQGIRVSNSVFFYFWKSKRDTFNWRNQAVTRIEISFFTYTCQTVTFVVASIDRLWFLILSNFCSYYIFSNLLIDILLSSSYLIISGLFHWHNRFKETWKYRAI